MNEQQLAAVKLALEAFALLDALWYQGANMNPRVVERKMYAAMDALRQAIAEAENARELGLSYDDEPKIGCVNHDCDKCKAKPAPVQKPLFAEIIAQHPGLAEELKALNEGFDLGFKAGLAAAQPAPVQEPVAYSVGRTLHWHEGKGVNDAQLYTTPPAAQPAAWVGLTEEDREQHRDDYRSNIHDDEFASIEAKLREKNGGAA